MAQATIGNPRNMRTFMIIWVGQLISLIGTGLTGFALGVWVYELTGSTTQYSLIGLFSILPSIVITPIAGVLVDRWNYRTTLILSDVGSALSVLVLALLLAVDRLEVWHIFVAMGVRSACGAFQWLAYTAATTILMPKRHLGRANSVIQLGQSASLILPPLLGGILFVNIALWGVILLDVLTYVVSIAALFLIHIPQVATAPDEAAEAESKSSSMWQEALYGWRYIVKQPALLGLLIFFAVTNLSLGIVQVLITPLALTVASAQVVGTVLSIGGTGMLAGGIVMTVWGGPRRRIYGVLGFTLVQGLLLLMGGIQPNAPLLATAIFIYLFCFPIVISASQSIWQTKVAINVQGRVFAARRMIALSALPFSYLFAGPLADVVFEPLMAQDGLLADSLGQVIGVGPGRGIGLLFIVLGVFMVLTVVCGFLYRPIRRIEEELPDVIPDDNAESAGLTGIHAY